MNSPDTFLHIPEATEVFTLTRRCLALHAIGVISGPNGCGKTTALKYLATHPEKCGVEVPVGYYLAATAAGPTRGLRDFLIDRGVKQVVHQKGLSMKMLAKIGHRELSEKGLRALIVDEGDALDLQSLTGFVALHDTCRDAGYPIATIFAGVREPEKWINQIAAAESRTLHHLKLSELSPEMIVAVFEQWGQPMEALAALAKANDKDAVAVLRSIHRGVDANFRKLYYFSAIAATEHQDAILTAGVVDEIFAKMSRKA